MHSAVESSERLFRGMGLGLAVVKHGVEVIGARDSPASSFVVTLPLRPSLGSVEHPPLPPLIDARSNGEPNDIIGRHAEPERPALLTDYRIFGSS